MSLAETLDPRLLPGANNPPVTLAEELADRYVDLLSEVQPVLDRAGSLPKKVGDDIVLGRLGDVVRDASKLSKKIEAKRVEVTEPHLTAQREIKGFFDTFKTRLEAVAKTLTDLATEYQNAKAAEARRILAEEARKAREEADRQRQIAEDAAAKNRAGAAQKHDDRAEEADGRAARLETAARASAADLTRVRTESGTVATSRGSWKFEIEDYTAIPLETLQPYLDRGAVEKAVGKYTAIHKGDGKLAGVRIFHDTKATFR